MPPRPPRPPSRKPPPSPASYSTVPIEPQSPPPKFPTRPSSSQSHNYNEPYMPPSSPPSSSYHGEQVTLVSKPKRKHRRTQTAQGVATGSIGSIYGPYSYQGSPVATTFNNPNRFSNVSNPSVWSDQPSSSESHERPPTPPTPPPRTPAPPQPNTETVPLYLWDTKDVDIDDILHNPDPVRDAILEQKWNIFTFRGWANIGCLVIILFSLIVLFALYPIIAYYNGTPLPGDGFNYGGINGTGQIPYLPNMPHLIDPDTPEDAFTRTGHDGHDYVIVFSDEFNTPGRTFYEGDDPYWEAVNLHYWATDDLEWYSPDAITTADGKLVITMTEEPINDLNFKSGMLQSWNKFCFTKGYIEVSISLPGSPRVPGLWPAAWTMGNLGRAGYGATTDGTWPYSYDSCDVGTFPNQTRRDNTPTAALRSGSGPGGALSYLPGQKLSACSCPGSDHPGPAHNFGRSAPEIDVVEALINTTIWEGEASQSVQAAPYNAGYQSNMNPVTAVVYDRQRTFYNSYKGGVYQQAISSHSHIGKTAYNGTAYQTYAFEYWTDRRSRDAGFVTWFIDGKETWTMKAAAMGPDPAAQISNRIVPEEPMTIIINQGIAQSFQAQDFKNLRFPSKMYVDYVRVYQRKGEENIGCDPKGYPTKDYIERHIEAYTNPNLTTWEQAGNTFPRNSLYDGC